jgi:DNA-binding winged helix-turn-helix (wHTH) protein
MIYLFQDFELDDNLYQLRRGGTPVAIEPKVFDVLAYLLHHHDPVVTKDELLEKLWPGQVVSETALTRCIVAARKAVGDDGTTQGVIETQHGRGYRFVAEVTEQTKAPEALPEETPALFHPTPSQVLPSPVSMGETKQSQKDQGEGLAQLPSGDSTFFSGVCLEL